MAMSLLLLGPSCPPCSPLTFFVEMLKLATFMQFVTAGMLFYATELNGYDTGGGAEPHTCMHRVLGVWHRLSMHACMVNESV
jgi:hypothetical protein